MRRQLLRITAFSLGLLSTPLACWAGSGDASSTGSINISINKELLSKNVQIENRKSDLTYALVRTAAGADSIFYCAASEIRSVDKLKSGRNADFLWFKQNGKTYLVQDAALLAKANEALKELDQTSRQMSQLGLEMGADGVSMGALGIKMAATVFQSETAKKMDALGKKMDEMGKQMDQRGKRMDALGKQQENVAGAAEPAIRGILQEAVSTGKATAL
ncbi:hypothetical protein LPB67_01510 [Undibacterium sp. Jales W-56]|uniref:hypothetical protein n=1 Tax=Undibacterium sp. Jales W-56 TaxID=2897325 RepID=UPI0021D26D0D|nr:hypothetical protein [Undibacterium sp. Jales W-56]MCU6432453.1 hypothetical protein [Undibacterium sp. Jales W-56]